MYRPSSSPPSRILKPSGSFTEDYDDVDDDIVADCAHLEKEDYHATSADKLIARDGSCPPPKTKLSEDGIRNESRTDSGFDSFGERFLSEESSNISYTRLLNNPQDSFSSSQNVRIDPNRSTWPQQHQYFKLASGTEPVDTSYIPYKPLCGDISPPSDVSDKFSKLTLSEQQRLQKSVSSTSNVVGSSQLNFWYEAFKQDKDGDTFLHLVIIREMHEVISKLIISAPHPAFLNLQNNFRQTPMHIAVLVGLPTVVRKLVVHGGLLEMRDHRGNTALHLVCQTGDYLCAEELLRPLDYKEMVTSRPLNNLGEQWKNYGKTQNLELRNYDGQTCIHLATICKHVEILKLLHSAGADINAREGKSGRAPLHFAVEMEDADLTELIIINCKANIHLRTFAGLTPIQLAAVVQNQKIKDMLNQQGAIYSDWESDDSSIEEMMTDDQEKSDFMINGQPLAW
uniref:Uncharacterized protein n=1 Tax=Strigamia maritima TaxID=126957 RepID=T1IPV4_STRMM